MSYLIILFVVWMIGFYVMVLLYKDIKPTPKDVFALVIKAALWPVYLIHLLDKFVRSSHEN